MLQNLKGFSQLIRQLSYNSYFFYHENVIDHYEKPRNVGSMDKKSKNIGTGLVGAPACGDVMKLQIKIGPDGHTIEDAVFKVKSSIIFMKIGYFFLKVLSFFLKNIFFFLMVFFKKNIHL